MRGAASYLFGRRERRRVEMMRLSFRLRLMVLLFSRRLVRLPDLPRARVWADREAFPRIRKLLRGARHTIIIQMFIWKDDRLGREMAAALLAAADRGVKVFISKEAVGDFFETNGDFLATRDRDDEPVWRRFWRHPNILVSHAVQRDHAKVYVIDDRILLLTGMNIADEYHDRWHDYLVELRGERYVQQYLARGDIDGRTGGIRMVMNTEGHKDIRPAVMALLRGAERSIVVEHCYLSDPAVLQALVNRSREGVFVTVIIPSVVDVHYYSNMQSVAFLLAKGSPRHLRVFLYPGMFHAKILLADRTKAFLGSANLITSSLDEMGEVNVLIGGRMNRAVATLRMVLRADLFRCRPLRSPPHLGWLMRLLAWMRL